MKSGQHFSYYLGQIFTHSRLVAIRGKTPILSIILLILISHCNSQDLIVAPVNTQINAITKYTLTINFLMFDIPQGSTLALTFPSEYSSTKLHNMAPYSGYDTTLMDFCGASFTCSVTISYSGSTFFLNGLFTQDYNSINGYFYMQFTIFNIQNPDYINVGEFYMTIYKGSTIYYPLGTGSSVSGPTFTPSTMPYTISLGTSTIWATSSLTITLTPNTIIDTLQFAFPSSMWTNQTVSSKVLFNPPICTSTSNPTLSCSVGLYLQASNLQYYSGGQSIDISISSIYNPTSLVQIGSISIYGKLNGAQVTKADLSIPASYFSNDILRQITSTVSYQANDKFTIKIGFSLAHVSMATDTFQITFPTDLVMPTTSSFYTITGSNTPSTPSITFNANNSLIFSPFSINLISKASLNITISNISRPRQCKSTNNFTISSFRIGKYLMDLSSCCTIPLANRETLLSSSPALSSQERMITPVIYSFNFTTNQINLITTDQLFIQFPPEYNSQITPAKMASVCASIAISAVNNPSNIRSATCSISVNAVLLTNFLVSDTGGQQKFIVAISGLKNPSKTPIAGFNLATRSTNGYILEEKKGLNILINANTLTTFTISSDSYVTNNINTKYTFTVGNNAPIYNGYCLKITFPSDITFINYDIIDCQVASLSMSCGRLNSTYNTSQQIVLISINTTITTIGTVSIRGITNPQSTQTTGSFSAEIQDASGVAVESNSNTLTITMASAGTFSTFIASSLNLSTNSITRQSLTTTLNSQYISLYLFLVTPFSQQASLSSLVLTLSSTNNTQYSNSTACISSQFTNPCSVTTDASSNILFTLSNITFTVNTNYIYLQVSNLLIFSQHNLNIDAQLKINGYSAIKTSSPVAISAMYVQPVSDYSITQTSYFLGQTTDITLSFNGLSITAKKEAVNYKIYIPLEYGASSYQLSISNSSVANNSITIASITNPKTQQYTPFLFVAYNANNDPIAYALPNNSSSTYTFHHQCAIPCKTCSTLNTSQCLSCYTDIAWISQTYLQNSTNLCVTTCADGQYLSGNTCYPCNENCTICLMYGTSFTNGSADICFACQINFYLLNSICYQTCPAGYYPTGSICAPCMSNCLSCSNYSSCSSCTSPYYLFNQQCLTICPAAYFAVVNSTNNQSICTACPSNCQVCTSQATCINCNANYFLSSGNCVSNCSGGLLPNYEKMCSSCQCLTCSTTSYNCTACSLPKSLYLSQCLSICPSGYYSNNNTCVSCMSNCAACTSSTLCSICSLPYVLSFSSATTSNCLAACPNGTIATIDSVNFSYICSACSNNCLTCSVTTSHCTSCSSPLLLTNNSCQSQCPANQFSFNGQCLYCYPECRSCNFPNYTLCYVCQSGYFMWNTACSTTCPNQTYPDISSLICANCSSLCLTCQNSTHCTSCISGYFLHLNLCYNNCQAIDINYFSYNGKCLYCQSQCSSCYNTSPYHCVNCSSSYYMYNPTTFSCTVACQTSYYANGNLCVPCAAPCLTCDMQYNSCLTCQNGLVSHLGQCLSACPTSYKNLNGACQPCSTNCLICDSTGCIACSPYAYLYHSVCVLDCSIYNDLPITVNNYCTNCAQVPNCQACKSESGTGYSCFLCIQPFVVFQGNCLNQCPDYYEADSNNVCQQTPAYAAALNQIYEQNKPKLPPFFFLIILVLSASILFFLARKAYIYTYHYGYMITLAAIADFLCICYGAYYIASNYKGNYKQQQSSMPLIIVAVGFSLKILLSLAFLIKVVKGNYLQDTRYIQWRSQNQNSFYVMVILTLIFGPRTHKIFYSKLWSLPAFSYRIVSVQKFYEEDVVNWLLTAPDLIDLAAFLVVTYNIFITYAVIYLVPFQLISIKVIIWLLFLLDLRKPDRGFFIGDEQQAEKQIKLEKEEMEKKKKKFQMLSLVKLIRCKSAGQLIHEKLYQFLFYDQIRSVYNPNDYEDPPKVPKKKIAKYIERGRFRRGKKISIQQKLKRFAQSIKPRQIKQEGKYIKDLIYWKPPKQINIKPKAQPRETSESMLNLLKDKEFYYDAELRQVEIQDLDDFDLKDRHHHTKKDNKNHLVFELDQETMGNRTFYDPNSIELLEHEDYDFNGLMNRNYARRQHLPVRESGNPYDEQEMRILHHKPLKKRVHRSRMNDLSIRRG